MTENPGTEDPDQLDTQYRRLAELDRSEPAEETRRKILAYAARQARPQLAAAAHVQAPLRATRARADWRRPTVLAALATAVVAAGIIAPRYLPTGPAPAAKAPSAAPPAPLQERAPAPVAPPLMSMPAERSVAESQQLSVSPRAQAAAPPAGVRPAPPHGAVGFDAGAARVPAAEAARQARSATGAAAAANVAPVAGLGRGLASDVLGQDQRFWQAAEAGDLTQLAALRPQQHDLNARDALGRTALMIATVHGQSEAAAALLAYGADPNAADLTGRTPLQVARAAGNTALIATLERYGAR
jgi:hypothetical protein